MKNNLLRKSGRPHCDFDLVLNGERLELLYVEFLHSCVNLCSQRKFLQTPKPENDAEQSAKTILHSEDMYDPCVALKKPIFCEERFM